MHKSWIIFLSLLTLCGTSRAQDAPLADCDKYAASDIDTKRISNPVPFKEINAAAAVPACTTASTEWPTSARLRYQLGRSLLADGKWFSGIQKVREAAENDYAAAQLALGSWYEMGGFGMVKDQKLATQWFAKAANQGNPKAQFKLGVAFEKGSGGETSETKAFVWYCKAAGQGDADARNLIASLGSFGTNSCREVSRLPPEMP